MTVERRLGWFHAHSHERRPLWVACSGGEVIAWIGLHDFVPRYAYHITAELSVYVSPRRQGEGLGAWLLRRMLRECPRLGVENIIALVLAHNSPSLKAHERTGFERWGLLPGATNLEGARRDVVVLGWTAPRHGDSADGYDDMSIHLIGLRKSDSSPRGDRSDLRKVPSVRRRRRRNRTTLSEPPARTRVGACDNASQEAFMTPEHISLVQKSWAEVLPESERAADLFYSRLFELDPSVRSLFTTDLREQGRKLVQMVSIVVDGLPRIEAVRPAIVKLGERHVGYRVEPEHYDTVGDALLWMLQRVAGDDFTPETRDAWAQTYNVLATEMKSAGAAVAL